MIPTTILEAATDADTQSSFSIIRHFLLNTGRMLQVLTYTGHNPLNAVRILLWLGINFSENIHFRFDCLQCQFLDPIKFLVQAFTEFPIAEFLVQAFMISSLYTSWIIMKYSPWEMLTMYITR